MTQIYVAILRNDGKYSYMYLYMYVYVYMYM